MGQEVDYTTPTSERQQIVALIKIFDEAYKSKAAAAVAALFTKNAVQVWGWDMGRNGIASGQDEIEKRFAIDLASGPKTSTKLLQVYPVGDDGMRDSRIWCRVI